MRRLSAVFALVFLSLSIIPFRASAKTYGRFEYLIFKPVGSFAGQFENNFYLGFGARRKLGKFFLGGLHGFFHTGLTQTSTAISVMRNDVSDPQESRANVATILIPTSMGLGIGPRDADLSLGLVLGYSGVMALSRYAERGPVPDKEIPLKGFGHGPFIEATLFSSGNSKREYSISARYHIPSFNLDGVSTPYRFFLFSIGIGTRFGKE